MRAATAKWQRSRVSGRRSTLVVPNPDKLDTLNHLLDATLISRRIPTPKPNQTPNTARRASTVRFQMAAMSSVLLFHSLHRKSWHPRRLLRLSGVERMADRGYLDVIGRLGRIIRSQTGSGRTELGLLLRELAKVPGIEGIRLSSHRTHAGDRLTSSRICDERALNHLHIPCRARYMHLRAMNRPYDQDFYLRRCEAPIECFPDLA